MIEMAAGDTGIRSVESIQLGTSAGSAGDIAVVLFKPIMMFGSASGLQTADQLCGWNEPILSEAHLDALQTNYPAGFSYWNPHFGYMDR